MQKTPSSQKTPLRKAPPSRRTPLSRKASLSRRAPLLRKTPLSQERCCRGNVVVAEAASGALRNRRRKRPPWLLCSESKVLCAFGTALSPTVTVARALIARLAVERSSPTKAGPPVEPALSSEMSLAAVPRLPTNAFMSRRTRLLPVKAHPSPAGACLLRSKARAIFVMCWSATQKPPSSSSCRARRPHLTFQ